MRRVQDALTAAGGDHTVVVLEQPARTSAEAARAVGCRVDQIAKSLVFRGEQTQRAVLVIASGANRVDERQECREDEDDDPAGHTRILLQPERASGQA